MRNPLPSFSGQKLEHASSIKYNLAVVAAGLSFAVSQGRTEKGDISNELSPNL